MKWQEESRVLKDLVPAARGFYPGGTGNISNPNSESVLVLEWDAAPCYEDGGERLSERENAQ